MDLRFSICYSVFSAATCRPQPLLQALALNWASGETAHLGGWWQTQSGSLLPRFSSNLNSANWNVRFFCSSRFVFLMDFLKSVYLENLTMNQKVFALWRFSTQSFNHRCGFRSVKYLHKSSFRNWSHGDI